MSQEKENFFKSLMPADRLEHLKEAAVSSYKTNVVRNFTEEEMSDLKTTLSEDSIVLHELKIEKKELVSTVQGKIKIKQAEIEKTLKDIKNKYYENEETVFDVDDQENGMMLTFDSEGNIIGSRRLSPKERQTTIKNLNTKAS